MNRPVRLAVIFDQEPQAGGGYQEAINAAVLIRTLPKNLCDPFFVTTNKASIMALREYGIEANWLPFTFWRKVMVKCRSKLVSERLLKINRALLGPNVFDAILERYNVDLVYFVSPSRLAILLERINYVLTVWDVCHRDEVEFPEVRQNREFERREQFYKRALPKAVAILTDSNLGRLNLIRRYGIDKSRVYVLPFSPAPGTQLTDEKYSAHLINIKDKYQLVEDYVFYPSQFWAHKNHIYLLRGLKSLEERYGIRLGAIFAGGNTGGNLAQVKRVAADYGLSDRLRYPGFVPNEEMPYLYRQSVALVMPTYFGPTNLPPLEAFHLGVPVLYSDLPGLREQVGMAALLMDLENSDSMADHLHALLSRPGLREEMIERGYRQLAQFDDKHKAETLSRIIERYRHKRDCWL